MEELICRALAGEATESELLKLDQWRKESHANERIYADFLQVWEIDAAPVDAPAVPPPPVQQIVDEAERRRGGVLPFRAQRRQRSVALRWVLAAAAAAVFLVTVTPNRVGDTPQAIFATGPSETRTISLLDGSVVRLGANTRLLSWSPDQRSLELEGTAFFAVATDSLRPFIVTTEAGEVEVLGTRFELRTDVESLRLVVVEGRVGLSAAGRQVVVGQGNMSQVANGSTPSPPQPVDALVELDWPSGLLIFQATPLRLALDEIATHFRRHVELLDSSFATRTVTAWFEDEPFDDVVNTVCQVAGARCEIGGTVEVTP